MIGNRLQWYLPVHETRKEAQVIHPLAKFHYFLKSEFAYSQSLCDKYFMVIEDFETFPNLKQWEALGEEYYCKKCLKALKKELEVSHENH